MSTITTVIPIRDISFQHDLKIVDMLYGEFALGGELEELINNGKKWDAYRYLYNWLTPLLLNGERHDPYFIDWIKLFTPIEYDAWQTIRYLGIPMWPQYPINNVFVDFADPVKKLVIECDGKAYHDKEKDAVRDDLLAEYGWCVFRVTGKECNKPAISEYPDEREFNEWIHNSSDGVISAIAYYFYKKRMPIKTDYLESSVYQTLCDHSRNFHFMY